MGQVIVITSGKGGVGKTTTTANLGLGLALRGYRVVVMDGDVGLRNLDLVLGFSEQVTYNNLDVIEGRCRLSEALIKVPKYPNFALLPTAQDKEKDAVNESQMRRLCAELEEVSDFVLIDCPAGIEQGFRNAVAAAHQAIVIATPDAASIRDAEKILDLLKNNGIEQPGLILNRFRKDLSDSGDFYTISQVQELLPCDVLGVVPDEIQVTVTSNRGIPIVLDYRSRAGEAFRNICRRMLGESVPFQHFPSETPVQKRRGIWPFRKK